MITQELIDYVKIQLESGVAREKITSDLLAQGGWTMEQITEALQGAQQATPVQASHQEVGLEMTRPPKSIKYFEWLMYASFIGSTALWLFQFATSDFQTHLIVGAAAMPLVSLLIRFVFVYLVVYRRLSWARIALGILFALSLLGSLGSVLFVFFNPVLLIPAIPLIIEIVAIYFVFTKDSTMWLSKPETITVRDGAGNVVSISAETNKGNVWKKLIPGINWLTGIVSLGILAIVDIPILVSSPELADFFYIMVGTLIGFSLFAFLENFVFRKTLKGRTSSGLDPLIMLLIVARNGAVVLSMIPVIQLLGMAAIALGGIPWILLYILILVFRFQKSNPEAVTK